LVLVFERGPEFPSGGGDAVLGFLQIDDTDFLSLADGVQGQIELVQRIVEKHCGSPGGFVLLPGLGWGAGLGICGCSVGKQIELGAHVAGSFLVVFSEFGPEAVTLGECAVPWGRIGGGCPDDAQLETCGMEIAVRVLIGESV
jgi:hypothetical protein